MTNEIDRKKMECKLAALEDAVRTVKQNAEIVSVCCMSIFNELVGNFQDQTVRCCLACANEHVSAQDSPCKECQESEALFTMWEPKPEPVETGIDADGRPKLWSWWNAYGATYVYIGLTENGWAPAIIFHNGIVEFGRYDIRPLSINPDYKFIGISEPGRTIDGIPLVGSKWISERFGGGVDTVQRIKGNHVFYGSNKYGGNLAELVKKFLFCRTFIGMSQLDTPANEKPISETIQVGDVVCNNGIDGSDLCEGPVIYVSKLPGATMHVIAIDEKHGNGAFWASASAINKTWTIVSRAAERPLHDLVRINQSQVRTGDGYVRTVKGIQYSDKYDIYELNLGDIIYREDECTLVEI